MMNHHGVFVAYCAGENFHLTTVTDKGREGKGRASVRSSLTINISQTQ